MGPPTAFVARQNDPAQVPPPYVEPPTAKPAADEHAGSERAPDQRAWPAPPSVEERELDQPAPHEVSTWQVPVAGNVTVEATGAQGQWLAYCPAATPNGSAPKIRLANYGWKGDSRQPVVQEVDGLLAASPGGRYMVALRGDQAWLVDAQSGTDIELSVLSPDLSADLLADHRSFSFSYDDQELAVLQPSGRSARILALKSVEAQPASDLLASSREVTWEAVAWRIHFDGSTLVVRPAASKGRPRGWPVAPSATITRRCATGSWSFAAFSSLSAPPLEDEVSPLLVRRGGVRAEPAPGFVFALMGGWVRRESDGRLLLVQGAVQKQLASSRCGARILHADQLRRQFLVACEQYRPVPALKGDSKRTGRPPSTPARFPLFLVSPRNAIDLGADTMRTGVDVPPSGEAPRFVPLRPGAESALLDLDEQKLIRLGADTSVVTTNDYGALLRRGPALFAWTPRGEVRTNLVWHSLNPLWSAAGSFVQGSTWGDAAGFSCAIPKGHEAVGLTTGGALVSATANGAAGVRHLRVSARCLASTATASELSGGD